MILGEANRSFIFQFIEKLDNNPQGRFVCKVCTKPFRQKSHCENHIESKHFSGTVTYQCKFCGQEFNGRNKLYIHTSKFHKGQNINDVKIKT